MAPHRSLLPILAALSFTACGEDLLQGLPTNPKIEVRPMHASFGDSELGQEQRFTFTIKNVGNAALHLGTDTRIVGETALTFETSPGGSELTPANTIAATVLFLPAELRRYDATMLVTSDDPEDPEVQVPLVGFGASGIPPVCDLQVTSGATGSGPLYSSLPSSYVTLSAAGSHDANYTAAQLTYVWTLASRPAGSAATLNAAGMTAGLTLDLADNYTVRVQVENPQGVQSGPCEVTIKAMPVQDLWVEMFWTYAGEDMDLHLTYNNAPTFDLSNDCYYSNCAADMGCPGGLFCPAWGAAGGVDDPVLDLDDIYEAGPENINIQTPAAGTYAVYVHDYPGSAYAGANPTTVRVYLGGNLVRTYVSTSNAATSSWGASEDNEWKVCTITLPSGTIVDNWQVF